MTVPPPPTSTSVTSNSAGAVQRTHLANMKSGRRREKVQGSIREEVEKLASKKHTRRPPPTVPPSTVLPHTVLPPSIDRNNSRLVAHWPRGGRRSKLCQKVTDLSWSPTLSSYLQGEMVSYSSTARTLVIVLAFCLY
eukprot:GFUD01113816.1.p1 GENE.GFUD01113816.1~~GFUD01113816.1.p1  ORF type:complete len:137 (-),score=49.84 GFUD01113816.1:209-619(-)